MRKPGWPLSPPLKPAGPPNHNITGNKTMRISEKAIALLLAVVISGTAFNTFIV